MTGDTGERVMRHSRNPLLIAILLASGLCARASGKEFLTPKEIERIQDAQEVDKRTAIYLEAAALRLKTVEERLTGKESAPGDPLEFFTVEDMLEGYYRILRSVMFTLDEATQHPRTEQAKVQKALKELKSKTEKGEKDLRVIKRLAEDKQLEAVWKLVNQALDINQGAHEGAELGLERYSDKKPPPNPDLPEPDR